MCYYILSFQCSLKKGEVGRGGGEQAVEGHIPSFFVLELVVSTTGETILYEGLSEGY